MNCGGIIKQTCCFVTGIGQLCQDEVSKWMSRLKVHLLPSHSEAGRVSHFAIQSAFPKREGGMRETVADSWAGLRELVLDLKRDADWWLSPLTAVAFTSKLCRQRKSEQTLGRS